jgi:hypothetical protein
VLHSVPGAIAEICTRWREENDAREIQLIARRPSAASNADDWYQCRVGNLAWSRCDYTIEYADIHTAGRGSMLCRKSENHSAFSACMNNRSISLPSGLPENSLSSDLLEPIRFISAPPIASSLLLHKKSTN